MAIEAGLQIQAGTTSKAVDIFINTSGLVGLGSLVFNSAGLIAYYHREGANASVQIPLITSTLGTWASGGFVQVDNTNMVGMYQLGIPNAALASGAGWVKIILAGASTMVPTVLTIELTAINILSADFGLLTSATQNNAAADALLNRANAIETGITPALALRYVSAAMAGVVNGASGPTITFAGINVATTRITATVDSVGDRSSITLT